MSKKNRLSLVALFMAVFLLLSNFSVLAEKAVPTTGELVNNTEITVKENEEKPPSPTSYSQGGGESSVSDETDIDLNLENLEPESRAFEELSYEEKVQYFIDNEIAGEAEARDLADESKRDTGQLAELAASSAEYYQNALGELKNSELDEESVLGQVKSLMRNSMTRGSSEVVSITNTGVWVERPYPGYTHRTKALIINPGLGQRVGYCVDPYYDLPFGETYVGDYHMNGTVAKIIYWGYGGPHTEAFIQRYEQMGVPDPTGYAYCDTVNAVRVAAGITDHPGVVGDGCVQWLIQHDPIPAPFGITSHDKNATFDATANEKISEWFETGGNPVLETSFTVHLHSNIGIQREGDATIYRTDQSWPAGTKFRLYLPWRTMGQVAFSVTYRHNMFQDYLFRTDNPDLQRAMSYRLVPTSATTEIRTYAVPMPPEPIEGEVKVKKEDNKTGSTPQGNASLDGATFQLFRDGTAIREATIKNNTASFGKVQVGTIQPETGDLVDSYTFQVKEKTPGEGYRVNKGTFTITPGKTEVVTVTAENDVQRGGVQIQKVDKELNRAYAQGDATLKGAEFSIVNKSANKVVVDGKAFDVNAVCKIITTDDKGYAATAQDCLPYGDYEIYESKASAGYKLDTNWKKAFTISEDNKFEDIRNETVKEPVIRGGVQIRKHDKELDKSEALGGANHGKNTYGTHLEGITFTIKNKSAHKVKVDGTEFEPNQDVKKITTHWNEKLKAYTAETAIDTLPYGTYTIRETATTDSYLLSDGAERTFYIREDGKLVTGDKDNKLLVVKDQVVRGDFCMVKIADGTSERLSVPWILTNVTTGERHVVVTDINGEFNSETADRAHSKETNANDGLIKKAEAGQTIKQSEMKIGTGLWFGKAEDGSIAKVDDTLGAMPYGKYTLEEVRCEANEGYNLQSIPFSIYRNGYTVNLGTITDDEIKIETLALDARTKSHTSFAGEEAIIGDTVSITGLTKDVAYEIRGRLVNLADGSDLLINGKKVEATHTFTAKKSDYEVKMNYIMDASDLAGKSVVVFIDLVQTSNGVNVAKHHELDNEKQMIHFPEIRTTATDTSSEDHFGHDGEEVTIIDRVEYSNLTPGEFYTVKGVLMNQGTGKELLDNDGKKITAEKEFFADEANGFVELSFTFDGSLLAGTTIVVFEDLYYDNIEVATHAEIEDKDQTVYYPKIGTSAVDNKTGIKEVLAEGTVTIKDTVHYKSMPVGREVTIKGILMDKETGKPLVISGKQVTSEVSFKPMKQTGDIDVFFIFDATGLEGKSLVVFERAYVGDYLLTEHEDLNDENQTIHFPKIKTTATDKTTGDHDSMAGETTIIDKVEYQNLIPGNKYQMVGTLYIKTGPKAGEPLIVDGKPVTATKGFTAKNADGVVELEFTFPSAALAGETIVVFEDCYRGAIKVATHSKIDDEDQSVHIPKIETTALDEGSNDHYGYAGELVTIIDTVKYTNLLPGRDYTMKGVLMNQATGERLFDQEGNEVTAELRFKPETPNGTVKLEFTFDASLLAGETTVVFEDLYRDNHHVATHSDIEDEGQAVHFPKIGTSATDANTGIKEILAEGEVSIVDVVKYENIPVGRELTIKGVLLDKDTAMPVEIGGEQVTSEVTFTPEKPTGEIEVIFTFDATGFEGRTFVVYEKAFVDDYLLANHEDLTDEDQTIYFPEIQTTATELESGSHYAQAGEETTITDRVEYKNLIPGKTYTMSGMLYVKSGEGEGEPLLIDGKPVTAEKEFIAEEADGFVELEFVFDSSALVGQTVVVFEDCYFEDIKVATHSDIDDEKQSVHIIQIGTRAWDKTSGTDIMTYGEEENIIDQVSVEGYFEEDKTYTLKAVVMDKVSGEPLMVNSEEVRAERSFTLADIKVSDEQIDSLVTEKGRYIKGTIEVEIPINIKEVATSYERELVVFEYLHEEDTEKPIATHEDLEDKEQTVIVKPVENPNPQTGLFDTTGGKAVALITAGAILVFGITLYRYRRRLSRR